MRHVLDENSALSEPVFVFLYWVNFVSSIRLFVLRNAQGVF